MVKDMVVIGAGLAGSSIAAVLARQGWDVLLVERDHLPRHKVCGEFLSPEAQTSLRALGLYAPIAALQPTTLTEARLTTQGGITLQTPLPGTAWGVSRFALDQALAQAAQAQGAEVQTGVTVKRYERVDSGYAVQLHSIAGPTTVQSRALIAACGRHSTPALPPPRATGVRPQQCVGIKLHYTGIAMPAQVELYFFPGGYVGLNPVEGGRVNLCLLASYATFALANKRVDQLIASAATWNPALGQRLASGTAQADSVTTVAQVELYRPATPWAEICCLGDTVTMIPPFCGDGMAMALRSAALCAPLADRFLWGKLSEEEWSAQYTHQWQREFSARLFIARILQRLFDQPLLTELTANTGRFLPGIVPVLVRATRG